MQVRDVIPRQSSEYKDMRQTHIEPGLGLDSLLFTTFAEMGALGKR